MYKQPVMPAMLAMAALIAGCAVGPRYEAPQVAPIALASPEQARFAAEPSTAPWWSFFDDPALERLIAAALEHNHDVRQAYASLQGARAMYDERELDRYPAVTAQAAWRRGVQQQAMATGDPERKPFENFRAGFDAQWEIDLFGRLAHLAASAQAQADAARADLDRVRLAIAADVARYHYEYQGLQRRLDVARAQAESWRQTVRLVDASVRAGSGLREDLENARANLARSEAAIAPLWAASQETRYRLDVLLGRRPGETAAPADAGGQAPLVGRLPLGDVDALIRNRPDVVRAERLLAASTENEGAATADLYPRVSLGGFIGFFALRGGDLGGAARAFEVAPTVDWPAFRLGSARARLRAAHAQSTGAQARYEQTLLLAQEEVEGALTRLARQQERLAALARSAEHARAGLEIATRRYRAGAGPYLAVLENQRSYYQISQEATEAETASYVNAVALYKALGWGMGTDGGNS
ncbi:TolC family protein [Pigmentiphaga sp. GD03639]|uniref:efflux transporter outer membrane subunit n=1 Tax=Pigmentiphaga sp. GD03639 TaxID=2975354 RepID=UPI002449BB20|nr:TolC family protein [Pigmentiphaga sp. GD03639]MDH2238442.1 TolC family protein [Pigmentiphaga sp. GD03639]